MPKLHHNQMTLAELIEALERVRVRRVGEDGEPNNQIVQFDFGGLAPKGLHSYRGFYEDLAIGFTTEQAQGPTLDAFVAELRAAIGSTITGYKGGSYIVRPGTSVWVAQRGDTSGTFIKGIDTTDWGLAVLKTRWTDL